MPYFDFHLHPSLKTMFSKPNAMGTGPWQKIETKAIDWRVRWCSDFEYILNSQSNCKQLLDAGANIVCVAIFAPERGMTTAKLLVKQARETLSLYLDPTVLKELNDPAASPFKLARKNIEEELLDTEKWGISDRKIKMLTRPSDYDPASRDVLYIAFTVEGAHSLANSFDRRMISADEVIKNLDTLRANGLPIISINLTHLEQYDFSNHAFGIQFVDNEAFRPQGNAITTAGTEVIKACYARNIMIDIKHMSLGARVQLFNDLRTRPEVMPSPVPLVCTHAGFTGLSYRDIPDYINIEPQNGKQYTKLTWAKPAPYSDRFRFGFNPSSINLYDDDIIAILNSGGMIGLSMDKRILGYTEVAGNEDNSAFVTEEEFVSNAELHLFTNGGAIGGNIDNFHCVIVEDVQDGGAVNPRVAEYHLYHFMAHVLHLIKVAHVFGYDINKALQQVCIGSDFDGLINPIWTCPSVETLDDFKAKFISAFPGFAKRNEDGVLLPADFDMEKFAGQLFFENGKNFVLARLEMLQPAVVPQ